jgi:hypothetical protein
MFFDNRLQSQQEMTRVLRPGGRVAVAVWDSYANSPGYANVIDLLARLFGEAVADELRQPFVLGDIQELQRLFAKAGIPDAAISNRAPSRFPHQCTSSVPPCRKRGASYCLAASIRWRRRQYRPPRA